MARVIILYGSQTGNAEEIARSLHDIISRENGLDASIYNMDQYIQQAKTPEVMAEYTAAVLVCSTTGQADVPDNARRFVRSLRNHKVKLPNLNYCVLGLGDTNYDSFNAAAIKIDTYLQKLDANRFWPTGLADDGTGLEEVVEPFKAGIVPAIRTLLEPSEVSPRGSANTTAAAVSAPDSRSKVAVTVVYGSQTGNSEEIAKVLG